MDERNEWWNGNEDGVFFRTERSVVVDHNIGTSRWTGIAEKGRRARSKENYGAGPTGLGLAIPVGFERALLCDDDFLFEVLRGLTAFLAGIERGERAVPLVDGGGRTVEHVTADALGGGRVGEWVPRDEVREARDGGTAQRIGRRKGLRGKHGVEGDGDGAGAVEDVAELQGQAITSLRRGPAEEKQAGGGPGIAWSTNAMGKHYTGCTYAVDNSL